MDARITDMAVAWQDSPGPHKWHAESRGRPAAAADRTGPAACSANPAAAQTVARGTRKSRTANSIQYSTGKSPNFGTSEADDSDSMMTGRVCGWPGHRDRGRWPPRRDRVAAAMIGESGKPGPESGAEPYGAVPAIPARRAPAAAKLGTGTEEG
eukprot:761361-Hanusia_phi.AAC.6